MNRRKITLWTVAVLLMASVPASEYSQVAQEASRLADKIDAAILPMMRKSWRWRLFYLRTKIDESSFLSRDARNPTALAAYAELTNIYHCERQNAGLLDCTWRGYTCPPFSDNDKWARHQ